MNGLQTVALKAQGLYLQNAPSWSSQVETQMTSTAGDVTTLLIKILALGLGIFALQWGVRKAMKFFKSTTN